MSRAIIIDAVRLERLASDPNLKSGSLAQRFGMNRAAFFSRISQDEELWRVYESARTRAGHTVNKAHLHTTRGELSDDEQIIIASITRGTRAPGELREAAIAAGVDAGKFSAILYGLENEKHEIWSQEEGRPLVTRFYQRGEEAEPLMGRHEPKLDFQFGEGLTT